MHKLHRHVSTVAQNGQYCYWYLNNQTNKSTNPHQTVCCPLIIQIYFWSNRTLNKVFTAFKKTCQCSFIKPARRHGAVWNDSFVQQRCAPSQSQARCSLSSTKWSLRVDAMSWRSAVWGQSVAQRSHCDNSSQVVLISKFTSVGKEAFIMRTCLKMKQFPTSTSCVFGMQLPPWTSSWHVSIIFNCFLDYYLHNISLHPSLMISSLSF